LRRHSEKKSREGVPAFGQGADGVTEPIQCLGLAVCGCSPGLARPRHLFATVLREDGYDTCGEWIR